MLAGVVIGVDDEPRSALVTGLGEVDHVAGPARSGLGPEAGVDVVRGLDAVARAAALHRPQPHLRRSPRVGVAAYALEVARPHTTQHPNRGQRGGFRRCVGPVQGVQEQKAIRPDLGDVGLALQTSAGQAPLLDPSVVARVPARRGERAQPVGGDRRDRVQGGTQGLGHQLDPVQVAHGGQHVRAVRSLTPAGLEQPARVRRVQHAGEQALGGALLDQAPAELAQDAVVETRVGEIEGEQVLPVDPCPDPFGRLRVAQAFGTA